MTEININNKEPYSLFHHELLDRLYTIVEMFDILIVNHENDEDILNSEEKSQMSLVLNDLYQMVGERIYKKYDGENNDRYRDWETDRKSTRLNSSHSAKSRMPSSA